MSGNYIVYDHISPSNKHYIGITCQSTSQRWGKGGCRYLRIKKNGTKCHPAFYEAIKKYGWNNFQHIILFCRCTKELAYKLEIAFISYWKSKNLSYNITDGGDFNSSKKKFSEEELKEHRHLYYLKCKEDPDWIARKNERAKKYRSTLNRQKERKKEKIYEEINKDKIKAKKAEYYRKNKESILQRQRQYSNNNKEKIAKRHKQYNEEHREEIRIKKKKYKDLHREEINTKARAAYKLKKQNHEDCVDKL